MDRLYRFLSALLVVLGLSACASAATPELIASFPYAQNDNSSGSTQWAQVIYNIYLEIEVSDTQRAIDRAEELVSSYGGYLVSSQSWFQDGRLYATLTLAVPAVHVDGLRNSLVDLGSLKSETVSGELVNTEPGNWAPYSQVTVQFRPRTSPSIRLFSNGWDPLSTFSNAFGVFVRIFGFLVDILIWVLVVAGPFFVIGWLIYRVIKKRLRP
ncbi:MAG: DUF4349 domain-containing protein [Chloroflexota bacterium]|nr:MAG: DUF4349 domain-containing protein [Chloroflexota bacterium]